VLGGAGRRGLITALLGATVIAALAPVAGLAVSSAASPSPATVPPASGVGSVSRVQLSAAGETATRCTAQAPDGAVWVLESGTRYQLVRVGSDGTLSAFPIPGSGASLGAQSQCLAVAADGGVWLGHLDASSISRFDPAAHTVRRVATPTPNSQPSEIAAGPNGVVWFDERAVHRIGRVDTSGRITEYRLPSAVSFGPYTLAVTPDGHVWAGATGVIATDPANGDTVSESIFEFDAAGALLHQLAVSESVVGAISVGLRTYVIAAGSQAAPFVGWGPYPFGVAVVGPGPKIRYVAWSVGDIPLAMALGADNRVWFVIPSGYPQNYGYIEPVTLRVHAFHSPKGVAPVALTAGPGDSVSFTADDNYLYRVDTGVSVAAPALVPSSITTSIPTPAEAFTNAAVVASSVALAVGGTLFITFPAQLFNLTFQENYPRITAWFARRRHRGTTGAHRRRDGLVFALVVAAGALLGAMLDPAFGRSWSSVTSYLAIVLALLTAAAVGGAVTAVYHSRTGHAERPYPLALPLGLAVAAVCLLVSRLARFQPGYLYGVVCGLAFHRRLSEREEGQVAAITILATLCVSILAWLLWVPLNHAATQPGAWFGEVLADNFLAALFVGGLVGSTIGLLPLRFLAGGAIRQWRPAVWATLFALAMFGVIDFLLRSPRSPGATHAPLVTTILLFVAFGGFAVAFREYFARRWRIEHGVTVRGVREWASDLLSPHVTTPAPVTPPAEHSPSSRG
jgi:streptogramin lyase